jgi:integrase
MSERVLLEPSFADVAKAIETATDLPARIRSYWLCGLRQIAKATNKPWETIPARWTAARFAIARLHHALVGMNAKTLANHKANAHAALRWYGNEKGVPSRGMPFGAEWEVLRNKLPDMRSRAVLSSLMRYCSAKEIAPTAVDEAIIDSYMRYRAETTALATDDAARRAIARVWNGCVGVVEGWPANRLVEPPVKPMAGPAWEEFPAGVRTDIENYLKGLKRKNRRTGKGKRVGACKDTTIKMRRASLVAAARMAVSEGVPIAKLTSLQALLDPEVAGKVIDAYWKGDGEEPSIYTIDLGSRFLSMARELGCFEEQALEQLAEIRYSLELHRRDGMTSKNLTVIRQVLSGDVWERVVNLPAAMMKEARLLREQAPIKAAVTAQIAVAIGLETVAPVRLGNLSRILLDHNLIKPGGVDTPYRLVFPRYDVKNRLDLDYPLDSELTALIDEYVHEFRPSLLRGSNELWLFTGEAGGSKNAKTLSGQITERIEEAAGLVITVHQFRHAAAALWLNHHPGDYETVRRVLGHRNIQTTIKFYCGLETTQANIMFGALVRKLRKADSDPEDE